MISFQFLLKFWEILEQKSKLRLREVPRFAESHTAKEWQNWV